MPKIIEGCQLKSDVKDKYSEFFHYINDTLKIEEDCTPYYQEQYNQHNIDESGLTDYFSTRFSAIPTDSIQKSLKLLNYINIKRQGINRTSFDDSKYVLITGKNFVMNMVADDEMKKHAPTYWATTIQFVTNRLWFRLNKGLGQGAMAPTAFNVVASAQVLLAAQLKNKITKSFAKFKDDVKYGKLTEDQVKIQYAGYRKDAIDADSITSSTVQDVLSDIISEDYYEKHLREEALLKQRLDESLAKGIEKDTALQKAQERISELEKKSKEQYDRQKRRIDRLLQKDIDNLIAKKKDTERNVEKIENKVKHRAKFLKILNYVLAAIFLIIVAWLCYKFGFNNIGSIITIVLFAFTVINLILIQDRKQQKQSWIAKLACRLRRRLFEKHGINKNSISEIDSEIASLKAELE